MSYHIGIDPGINGGVSVISDRGLLGLVMDMPTMQMSEKKREIDAKELSYVLEQFTHRTSRMDCAGYVYLEIVHAMPGNGVSGMFSFGMNYGAIRAACQITGFIIVGVTPQKWKKHFNLIGEDKKEAGTRIVELYPNEKASFYTPRGRLFDGRADAALIARYAYDTTK